MKLSLVAEVTEKFGSRVAARDARLWASANSDYLTLWHEQTPIRSVEVPGWVSGPLVFSESQDELLMAPFRFNLDSQQWTPSLSDLGRTLIDAVPSEGAIDGQLEILRGAYSPNGDELWVAIYIRPPRRRRRRKSRRRTWVKSCVFRLDGQSYHVLNQMLSGERISGCMLISSSYAALANHTLWLFERPNLTLQAVFKENKTFIEKITISPDGQYLASGSANGQIGIWDLAERRLIKLWSGHTSPVTGLQFLPQNLALLSVGGDGQVKLWPESSGEVAPVVMLEQSAPITGMSIDPTGKRMIIAIESATPCFQLFDIDQ